MESNDISYFRHGSVCVSVTLGYVPTGAYIHVAQKGGISSDRQEKQESDPTFDKKAGPESILILT